MKINDSSQPLDPSIKADLEEQLNSLKKKLKHETKNGLIRIAQKLSLDNYFAVQFIKQLQDKLEKYEPSKKSEEVVSEPSEENKED